MQNPNECEKFDRAGTSNVRPPDLYVGILRSTDSLTWWPCGVPDLGSDFPGARIGFLLALGLGVFARAESEEGCLRAIEHWLRPRASGASEGPSPFLEVHGQFFQGLASFPQGICRSWQILCLPSSSSFLSHVTILFFSLFPFPYSSLTHLS